MVDHWLGFHISNHIFWNNLSLERTAVQANTTHMTMIKEIAYEEDTQAGNRKAASLRYILAYILSMLI